MGGVYLMGGIHLVDEVYSVGRVQSVDGIHSVGEIYLVDGVYLLVEVHSCNVMKSYDHLRDRSNLIGTISYYHSSHIPKLT